MNKQQDWIPLKNAFRETPPAFKAGVEDTLRRLQTEKEEEPKKKKIPLALVIALTVMMLAIGAACAASLSPTIDWFGWFYGKDFQAELEKGDIAPANTSFTLGDLTYTLDDVVYSKGVLYGTGTIAVAEGKEAVLITEDYAVDDPAGYMLHMGEETIPDGAPTYAQLAKEKGCKILLGKVVPDGYWLDGQHYSGDNGYTLLPQQDGTIQFAFEIYVGDQDPHATVLPQDGKTDAENLSPINKGIQRDDAYTLNLRVSNWEVTPQGEWLREEPNNTWLKEEWILTVLPENLPEGIGPADNG